MKKTIKAITFVLIAVILFAVTGCNVWETTSGGGEEKESGKVIDMYLIGGQSNAAGATEHKNALNGVFENVGYAGMTNKSYKNGSSSSDHLSSYEKYKWAVTTGLGELSTRMGPEYGMAEILNEQYEGEKKAFIFKSAAGATTMVANCTVDFGTWLPRSMWDEGYDPSVTTDGIGYQYYTFIENFAKVYNTLIENGYSPKVKGMAWYQGGSDLAAYRQYGNALYKFINDIRADLYGITGDENVKKMPFVIGKIPPTFEVYNNPLVPRFNEVQQEVADLTENCETIESSDLIINNPDGSVNGSDRFHFNYNDSRMLGNRFAQKILEMNK
ncbi:MAG: hypothetical protein IJU84_01260 [Clostridia bacterium]|nr:hypothetical protein [Clostridia bacterium]